MQDDPEIRNVIENGKQYRACCRLDLTSHRPYYTVAALCRFFFQPLSYFSKALEMVHRLTIG